VKFAGLDELMAAVIWKFSLLVQGTSKHH